MDSRAFELQGVAVRKEDRFRRGKNSGTGLKGPAVYPFESTRRRSFEPIRDMCLAFSVCLVAMLGENDKRLHIKQIYQIKINPPLERSQRNPVHLKTERNNADLDDNRRMRVKLHRTLRSHFLNSDLQPQFYQKRRQHESKGSSSKTSIHPDET